MEKKSWLRIVVRKLMKLFHTKVLTIDPAKEHEEKNEKAMEAVTSLPGTESLAKDPKEKKLIVIGDVDPVAVVSKRMKLSHTEVLTTELVKELEKEEEPKKEKPKKRTPKKAQYRRATDYLKKFNPYNTVAGPACPRYGASVAIRAYNPTYEANNPAQKANNPAQKADNPSFTQYYHVYSDEENPNACVTT